MLRFPDVLFAAPFAFRLYMQVRDTFCVFRTKRLMEFCLKHDTTNSKSVPKYLRTTRCLTNLSVVYCNNWIMAGAIRSCRLAFFFVGLERRHALVLTSRGMLMDEFDLISIHTIPNVLGWSDCDPLHETPLVDHVLGVVRVSTQPTQKNREGLVAVNRKRCSLSRISRIGNLPHQELLPSAVRHSVQGGRTPKPGPGHSVSSLNTAGMLQHATAKLNNASQRVVAKATTERQYLQMSDEMSCCRKRMQSCNDAAGILTALHARRACFSPMPHSRGCQKVSAVRGVA